MRILFVLENYFPNIGGVETLFKSLVDSLVSAGHHCTVITSRLSRENTRLEEKEGLVIIRIPVANRYFFTLQALVPIFKYIRSCDLVQTTSYNAALPAFIGAVFFRKRIAVTFHEAWGKLWFRLPYMGYFSKSAHYWFEQFLLRLPFDRFIAVSKNTEKRLLEEGVNSARVCTIYNGIDYADFSNTPKGLKDETTFTFTYFGRLGISKGLDLLLQTAIRARQEIPDSRLQLIVPTTPESFLKHLKLSIRQHDLENYIVFKHHLPFSALKEAILNSDCVVIPSYSEGFCFAAVETAALGIPIISSNQASLPEVVSGQMITMENFTEEGLLDAMKKAYAQEWQELPLRFFHLKDTLAAYLKLYRELGK